MLPVIAPSGWPSSWNQDVSIFKYFEIKERVRLRFTADIFNETGLAGSREAFAEAFTALAKEG